MHYCRLFLVVLFGLGAACQGQQKDSSAPKTYDVRGVVREVKEGGKVAIIQHEKVQGYMDAMTMPFKAKEPKALDGIKAGDQVRFQLLVTEDESWIERVQKTGQQAVQSPGASPSTTGNAVSKSRHPLLDYAFTNQLGKPVRLSDFKGEALAITFFFTRCPIPDYCPRLSKNFQEASKKLAAMPDGPTNYHFLSVSFDTTFDTPEVLKAYAERYQYDPTHWSFITGPQDRIAELARLSDVNFSKDGSGFFDHGFRTQIIDARGRLQMSFPIGGNLSDAIVSELIKAADPKER